MVTIHPHKGYLNTEFQIHLTGKNELSYSVYNNKKEFQFDGIASPNRPQAVKFPDPGDFTIKFEDGKEINLSVVDGYRFGGSKFKNAFIFDECPWVFIIMFDRTYFYNRETEESYVEPISPDKIIEISNEYVLFEIKGQNEKLIYSLNDQKPILEISNVLTYNENGIAWIEETISEEDTSSKIVLKVYSFKSRKIEFDDFIRRYIVGNNKIFIIQNKLKCIYLYENICVRQLLFNTEGVPITVVDEKIAIYYINGREAKKIFVYDLLKKELLETLQIDGVLAKVNDIQLIDINARIRAIRNFRLEDTDFPEASIEAEYTELLFMYSDWKIFYTVKNIKIFNSRRLFEDVSNCYITSLGSTKIIPLENNHGGHVFINDAFCFYNHKESFTQGKNHTGSGYLKTGKIFNHNKTLILKEGKIISKLTPEGYWDKFKEGTFDLQYFKDFNIVYDEEKGYQYGFGGIVLGKIMKHVYHPYEHLSLKNYIVLPGGILLKSGLIPLYHSQKFNYGIQIKDKNVFLLKKINTGTFIESQILKSLFDNSEYRNVLFSEDGSKVISHNGERSTILKYKTGETLEFECESYIHQFNGIKPFFKVNNEEKEKTRKVEIINPNDGSIIHVEDLRKYVFICPNMKYYADTNLSSHEYYFDLLNNKEISSEEENIMREKLEWIDPYESDNPRNKVILERRKEFIQKNLNKLLRICSEKDIKYEEEKQLLLTFANPSKISPLNNSMFFELIIELRGRVIIRDMKTSDEVEHIELGPALWFLNYVSFSFDNRYVCIGGRYPNGSHYSGLFLIYDIQNHRCLRKETDYYAIWTTAFNRDGKLAAYSSKPTLYYDYSTVEYTKRPKEIYQRSFLSFSPNGKYIALSTKGYVAYNDFKGNRRVNWGHLKTTEVFICKSSDPETPLVQFNDLSEDGIEGTSQKQSVASVSFSTDNKKLMMVGNDGVVIIRNLHLEDYAGE